MARCQVCGGNGIVVQPAWLVPRGGGPGLKIPRMMPCPACGGSAYEHCCEGDRAQPNETVYLTPSEQRTLHRALRRSVKILPPPNAADTPTADDRHRTQDTGPEE